MYREPFTNPSGRFGMELLGECRRFRELVAALQNSLLERAPQEAIFDNGRMLGVVSGSSESPSINGDEAFELPAVLDYTFYTFRRGGRSLVDEYLAEQKPEPGSDTDIALTAMQRSRFSLFQVGRVSPPGGCLELEDLLYGDRLFLMEPQLSQFAASNRPLNIAGRVIPLPQFWQPTGAIAFIHPDEAQGLSQKLLEISRDKANTSMSRLQEPDVQAHALKLCMASRRAKIVRRR